MSVAVGILKNLGGQKFVVMTGSHQFCEHKKDNALTMKLRRNQSKANYLKITLNGSDLYDMEFIKIISGNMKTVAEKKDVYNDMLQGIFTEVTGLYTHL